ncbi:MAG: hypothetical protein U0169_24280 [Polyangiaceae bacterium]
MMPRWVRTFLVFAVALATWTVVRPAMAASSAPFCDGRGATTFAPAPQLQAPVTSMDPVDTDSGCRVDDKGGTVERHRTGGPEIPASDLHAAPHHVPVPAFAAGDERVSRPTMPGTPRTGVHADVERPPRA